MISDFRSQDRNRSWVEPDRSPEQAGAGAIYGAFELYQTQFRIITRRAQMRFENCDWLGMQSDAAERLDLYQRVCSPLAGEIAKLLQEKARDRQVWAGMKSAYSAMIARRPDRDLAETFFNSVTRRIFTTVGVDPQVEYVDSDFQSPPVLADAGVSQSYSGDLCRAAALIESILTDFRFRVSYENLKRDAELVAGEIQAQLGPASPKPDRIDVVRSVFYRGKGAYVIGRIIAGGRVHPLALCLLNKTDGIAVDAALMTEDEVSVLFSFTRSYFHVHIDHVHALVEFLKSIMPRKPVSELYISIGRNKHGKTILYRDLLHHLQTTEDRFEIAQGARGMVMTVFTLQSFEVVFKIIKDHFDYPKKTTRREVMEKYRLVFAHDRAGRLVDAQEFEHLKFERSRFSDSLLAELQRVAKSSVMVDEDSVVIKHLYTERRITPLDIYLQNSDRKAVEAAVIDFGSAIKDLAQANIFTGDVLVKNFGVTRHGRIVSYDYDELCLVTECNLRTLPQARSPEEELSSEPWYHVGEYDYFPQEFETFFGLTGRWRKVFRDHHSDLFDVGFWRQIQARIRAGEVIHIFPYPPTRRLSKAFVVDRTF